MQPALIDNLVAFIRERMEAAARDKALYERDGARLNSQLLQGEINMGAAVLAWLQRQQTGLPATEDEEETGEADIDGA